MIKTVFFLERNDLSNKYLAYLCYNVKLFKFNSYCYGYGGYSL